MKITRVESILLAIPFEDHGGIWRGSGDRKAFQTLMVRIDTDQGLSGWGEVFTKNGELALKALFDTHVAPVLLGRDATQISAIKRELERLHHNFGRVGVMAFCVSAVDLALWDILGQAAGLPLYRLLGGAGRNEIPLYASLTRYGEPRAAADTVERAVREGYGAVKLHEVLVETVPAARAAAGREIALMLDTNCPWSLAEARCNARRLEPYDLMWLEEPTWPPENMHALAALRRSTTIPIAAGENAGSLADYRVMLEAGAVDFVQPDIAKAHGLSEALKIAALAEAHDVQFMPHCFMIGPGYVHTLHLAAALEVPLLERYYVELAAEPMGAAVTPANGRVSVPQGPGLGCVPDPYAVRLYRVG
ncbi:mandelate racemase/muconate lactonizing enzyme family protein [Vineibacter terrae]|uniref:Mandelate racemase/muconate lactonizing enzyme family protein n=1 Tax=Vineibacter terrae TaxID=2586908 RepID=A0A5C8PG46_9HYPH|nr:mandelate racemase/muconate lactonizing enzyme family protein [Vineibacter terrae]TXL72312.1 mandelate racemase/muconate lactonizing enzyme family protein [Vineibacter terrae]